MRNGNGRPVPIRHKRAAHAVAAGWFIRGEKAGDEGAEDAFWRSAVGSASMRARRSRAMNEFAVSIYDVASGESPYQDVMRSIAASDSRR